MHLYNVSLGIWQQNQIDILFINKLVWSVWLLVIWCGALANNIDCFFCYHNSWGIGISSGDMSHNGGIYNSQTFNSFHPVKDVKRLIGIQYELDMMMDLYKRVMMTGVYKRAMMTGVYKRVMMTGVYKRVMMTGVYKRDMVTNIV